MAILRRPDWSVWALFTLFMGLLAYYFFYNYPAIGDDNSIFFPFLTEGADFFKKNGLAIQHFSRRCGGIPYFADPLYFQFAPLQFFWLFLPPLWAIGAHVFFHLVIGFFASKAFFQKILKTSAGMAQTGALLYLFNGYIPARILTGHHNTLTYCLIPLILLWAYKGSDQNDGKKGKALFFSETCFYWVLAAFVFSVSMVWGGSHYGGPALLLAFGVCHFFVRRFRYEALFIFGMAFALFSVARFYAIFGLLPHIHHHYLHPYLNNFFNSLKTGFSILFLPSTLSYWGEYKWSDNWTDNAYFFSPLSLIPILLYFKYKKGVWRQIATSRYLFLVLFSLFMVATAGGYTPIIYMIYNLPVVSSLWVPQRHIIGMMFPFTILFTFCFWQLLTKAPKDFFLKEKHLKWFNLGFFLTFAFSMQSIITSRNITRMHMRHIPHPETLKVIGALPIVTMVEKRAGWSDSRASLYDGKSSIDCYAPTYGYALEGLDKGKGSGPVEGPIWKLSEGTWNFRNPSCILYPEENGCKSNWENVRQDDKKNLDLFLKGYRNEWKLSRGQEVANSISYLSFAVFFLFLLLFLVKKWVLKRKVSTESLIHA